MVLWLLQHHPSASYWGREGEEKGAETQQWTISGQTKITFVRSTASVFLNGEEPESLDALLNRSAQSTRNACGIWRAHTRDSTPIWCTPTPTSATPRCTGNFPTSTVIGSALASWSTQHARRKRTPSQFWSYCSTQETERNQNRDLQGCHPRPWRGRSRAPFGLGPGDGSGPWVSHGGLLQENTLGPAGTQDFEAAAAQRGRVVGRGSGSDDEVREPSGGRFGVNGWSRALCCAPRFAVCITCTFVTSVSCRCSQRKAVRKQGDDSASGALQSVGKVAMLDVSGPSLSVFEFCFSSCGRLLCVVVC